MNSKFILFFIFELDIIIILGGFLMVVVVLLMLENKIFVIKMFLGFRFNILYNLEGYLFLNDNVFCLYFLMDYFLN